MQKTAYEMRISDWSSDVCSSDLARPDIRQNNPALWTPAGVTTDGSGQAAIFFIHPTSYLERSKWNAPLDDKESADRARLFIQGQASAFNNAGQIWAPRYRQATRSEEHTSELQSLMRISYAVFCLKKKKTQKQKTSTTTKTKHED